MSQLPESTDSTCIDKEPKIRALPGKHGKFLLSSATITRSTDSQIRDISSSSICINSGGNSSNITPTTTTANIRSGSNVDDSGYLKSPTSLQYSSLIQQTKRQMRTQNAFVSSSSTNSVSNNCDSKNLNQITTTVTSQIGVPATIENVEGKKNYYFIFNQYK